jgi:hypothetical protein
MKTETKSIDATIARLNQMHDDLTGMFNRGITIAIEIGELLDRKKSELPHGSFGKWINENLIFSDRTARNYMQMYKNKDRILEAKTINEAYKLLTPPKTETVSVFNCTDEAWESLLKLGALLEQAEPEQIVTGILHGAKGNQANIISIVKHENDCATYQLVNAIHKGEEMGLSITRNDVPVSIEVLLMYLTKSRKLNIEGASWIFPGVNYKSN